jgi:hypothetical protein
MAVSLLVGWICYLHALSISAPVSSPYDVTYSTAAAGSFAYSYHSIDTC